MTFQVGSEIFGDASIDSDVESINLMVESLKTVGVNNLTLGIGESGLVNLILDSFSENPLGRKKLESILAKKSQSDIKELKNKGLSMEKVDLLLSISKMYGDKDILNQAEEVLMPLGERVLEKIRYLKKLLSKLEFSKVVKIQIDLGEVPGFKYHTGVVFSAFSEEVGYCLSKGGRYDGLTKEEDISRPAVGFDLDLLAVTEIPSMKYKNE